MTKYTPRHYQTSNRVTHEWSGILQIAASCLAATEVLAVAAADGGGSCGDGLSAPTPILTVEIKREKKKIQQPDCCCLAPHSSEAAGCNWCLCDAEMEIALQLERLLQHRNVGNLWSDISDIYRGAPIHHLGWLLPSYMPDCAAQPPHIHLVSESHCTEPFLTVCVFDVSTRQNSEAVEDQRKRQASGRIQPEG